MRFKAAGILIVAVLAASCGNRRAEHFEALPFPDIVPPAMMEDPLDRAEYMALNMWNSLLDVSRGYPSDSVMVSGVLKTDIEQKFANWSQILGMVRQQSAEKAVGRLFEKVSACERKDTSSTAFETFRSLVEKYLFDANSPLRNEDFYGVYYGQLALPVKPDKIKYLTNNILENCVVTNYDTGMPVVSPMYDLSKATSKDPYELFLCGNSALVTIENPNALTSKELIVFRDSFGSSMVPLLATGYSKVTLVDIRYINSGMLGGFIKFKDQDVLFLYSTLVLNSSTSFK